MRYDIRRVIIDGTKITVIRGARFSWRATPVRERSYDYNKLSKTARYALAIKLTNARSYIHPTDQGYKITYLISKH